MSSLLVSHQQSQVMGACTYLFCRYYLSKIPNYRHCITSLHQDDTRRYRVHHLHPLIYANEYTNHIQKVSLVVAFQYHCLLWKNCIHFLHCIFVYWHCAPSMLAEYFLVSPSTFLYQQ